MAKGRPLEELEVSFNANIKDIQSKFKQVNEIQKKVERENRQEWTETQRLAERKKAIEKELTNNLFKEIKARNKKSLISQVDVQRKLSEIASDDSLSLIQKQMAIKNFVVQKLYMEKITREAQKQDQKRTAAAKKEAERRYRIAKKQQQDLIALAQRRAKAAQQQQGGVSISDIASVKVHPALIGAGAIAATTNAMYQLVKATADLNREQQLLASQAGMTAEQFKAIDFAASQYGMTGERVADITKDIRDKAREYQRDGTGAFQDVANELNLTHEQAKSLAGEMVNLSGAESMGLLVKRMESAGLNANQMTQALESMGNDASRLIPLFADNSKELDRLTGRYRAFVGTLSEEELKDFKKFSENIDIITAGIKSLVDDAIAIALPAINAITDALITLFSDKDVDSAKLEASIESTGQTIAELNKEIASIESGDSERYAVVQGRGQVDLLKVKIRAVETLTKAQKDYQAQLDKVNNSEPGGVAAGVGTPTGINTEELLSSIKSFTNESVSERVRLNNLLASIDEAQADNRLSGNKDLQVKLLEAEKNIQSKLEKIKRDDLKREEDLLIKKQVLASRWRESLGIAANDEQAIDRDNFANKLAQVRQFYLDNTDALIKFGLSKQEIIDRQNQEELEAQRQHEERIKKIREDIRLNAQESLVSSFKDTFSEISDIENANVNNLADSWIESFNNIEEASKKLGEEVSLTFEQATEIAAEGIATIAAISSKATEEKLNQRERELDEWYDKERYAIEKNRSLSDEDRERQLIALDEQKVKEDAIIEAERKKNFERTKKLNIATALMNTALGVTKAIAQGGMFGAITGAIVAGLGAVQIAAIQAQQYSGKAHNGIDSVPGAGDQTWILKGGERIVQPEANKRLTKFLDDQNRGMSRVNKTDATVNVNLNGDVLSDEMMEEFIVNIRDTVFNSIEQVNREQGNVVTN